MHIFCIRFTVNRGLQKVIMTIPSLKQKLISVDAQNLQSFCVLITGGKSFISCMCKILRNLQVGDKPQENVLICLVLIASFFIC